MNLCNIIYSVLALENFFFFFRSRNRPFILYYSIEYKTKIDEICKTKR